MKNAAVALLGFLLLALLCYGAWEFDRWFNYKMGYESLVNDQIIKKVKPDCLKESNEKKDE